MSVRFLGLHQDTNAGAAVIDGDGRVLAAVAEGRLSRVKYDAGFPMRALRWLSESGAANPEGTGRPLGRTLTDPDVLPVVANPLHPLPLLLGERMPSGARDFLAPLQTAHLAWHELLFRSDRLKTFVAGRHARLAERALGRDAAFVGHHAAHAASAYYAGPFPEATVVTCDNLGDGECASAWHGREGRLEPLWSVGAWHSPGQFYGEVASLLGIDPMTAGKVTGLAARGEAAEAARLLAARLALTEDRRGFVGPPLLSRHARARSLRALRGLPAADVAAGAQRVLEDALVPFVLEAVRATGCPRVAVAGGVFANVSLNRALLERREIESLSVHPAMSDQGIALGAALLHRARLDPLAPRSLPHVFLGPSYDRAACAAALAAAGIEPREADDPAAAAAELLAEGRVVARFDGALEYGPRALGNRSVLARPDLPALNDTLNAALHRSEYMPFAPVTLAEAAEELYEGLDKAAHCVPFMTVALPVRDAGRAGHAGVVHVDGTARPQVLRPGDNPGLEAILRAFRSRTGLPSLVNTSFNLHGEPIVCTPHEAVRTWQAARLDALLLGPFLVVRRP